MFRNQRNIPLNPVRPELLFTELNSGVIEEDDYLAQAAIALDKHNLQSVRGRLAAREAIHWSERQRVIADDSIQNGYVPFSDGCWYIAADETYEGCTADMFTWWINYCDDSEKFRWWHPRNHLEGGWDPQFYGVPVFERLSDHFVNHTHVLKHNYSKTKNRIHNDYLRVESFFDSSAFDANNIKGCIIARSHVYDDTQGDIAIGFIVYVLKEVNGSLIVKTRIWLGSFEKITPGFPPAKWVNVLANTWLFRKMYLPETLARSLWLHAGEQSVCLKSFLCKVYTAVAINKSLMKPKASMTGRPNIDMSKRGFFDTGDDDDDDNDNDSNDGGKDAEASEVEGGGVGGSGSRQIVNKPRPFSQTTLSSSTAASSPTAVTAAPPRVVSFRDQLTTTTPTPTPSSQPQQELGPSQESRTSKAAAVASKPKRMVSDRPRVSFQDADVEMGTGDVVVKKDKDEDNEKDEDEWFKSSA
eukprot:gene9754-20287_t